MLFQGRSTRTAHRAIINDWIISVDSSTNPSQSLFNHFEDAEPLFRHMVPHSPVHAQSRANFIKSVFQRPKFCTEARDSVLKPAHTIGGCRSSPGARSQRSPWFSRPAIAASPESHILSDSAHDVSISELKMSTYSL